MISNCVSHPEPHTSLHSGPAFDYQLIKYYKINGKTLSSHSYTEAVRAFHHFGRIS